MTQLHDRKTRRLARRRQRQIAQDEISIGEVVAKLNAQRLQDNSFLLIQPSAPVEAELLTQFLEIVQSWVRSTGLEGVHVILDPAGLGLRAVTGAEVAAAGMGGRPAWEPAARRVARRWTELRDAEEAGVDADAEALEEALDALRLAITHHD